MLFQAAGKPDIEGDEGEITVAVNFPAILDSMIWEGVTVELLIVGFVRRLQPRVLTIMKAERLSDPPTFVHRFVEVLYSYSALFDSLCMELCLDRRSPDRVRIERIPLGSGLRNILPSSPAVALEDLAMHASIEKWQYLLSTAGFQATQLSEHALYQAKLLLRLYTPEAFKLGGAQRGAHHCVERHTPARCQHLARSLSHALEHENRALLLGSAHNVAQNVGRLLLRFRGGVLLKPIGVPEGRLHDE